MKAEPRRLSEVGIHLRTVETALRLIAEVLLYVAIALGRVGFECATGAF